MNMFIATLITVILAQDSDAVLKQNRAYVAAEREKILGKPTTKLSPDEVQARKQMQAAVRDKNWLPTLDVADLHDGEFGRLNVTSLRVFQITEVEKGTALLEDRYLVSSGRRTLEGKTITPSVYKSRFVIARGLDLKNVVDGKDIDTANYVFRVAGTKTYKTTSGATKTVFVLESVSPEDTKRVMAK